MSTFGTSRPSVAAALLSATLCLALSSGCARRGFEERGAADNVVGSLTARPALIEDRWVEQGTKRTYTAVVTYSGVGSLPALKLEGSAPWITASVTRPSAWSAAIKVLLDATSLSAGDHQGTLKISPMSSSSAVAPATITLHIRVLALKQLHVGVTADACRHLDSGGKTVTTCDYSGQGGLIQAAAAATAGRVHIHLHDDGGKLARYDGSITLMGQSWLSAAEGSDPALVQVIWPLSPASGDKGVVRLLDDDIHLSRFSILCRYGGVFGVMTKRSMQETGPPTGGHLIENLRIFAPSPEVLEANSIQAPIQLGSDTTVRNCRFEGYFELEWLLDGARGTRVLQNTFVTYQRWADSITVRGSQDLVFANNVFIGNTRVRQALIVADAETSRLTVVGNVVEGVDQLITGLSGRSHVIEDNALGPAPLESPARPLFLAQATSRASDRVPGEGVSLDGVAFLAGSWRLPGALQQRSTATKRRMSAKVGAGSCGGAPCDFDASLDNEVQQAVWSVWRGGTVEIYPSAQPYAGNAVIGWPLTLKGMGSRPGEVVLRSAEELPSLYRLWSHQAVLVVLTSLDAPVLIENLTVEVVTDAEANERALWVASHEKSGRTEPHVLRRLRLVSSNTTTGLAQAMLLGNLTQVQDVLVHGDFGACITYGVRPKSSYSTPKTTGQAINLTCRLTGSGTHAPRAVFEVASVTQTLLANIVVDLDVGAPLLRAQRRSEGDSGTNALDLPASFTLHSVVHRGVSDTFDGFVSGGAYTLTAVHAALAGEPIFVSDSDSHLAPGAKGIDSGVDPSTLDPALKPGVDLDGVSRQGKQIDRGAYEQGQ